MSLGNLHNPKAAADLIADFRRRFSSKVCMAPHPDHDARIVSAHTMSVEAVLRKVSKDGHVYAPNFGTNFSADVHPIEIKRQGLRDVSVFNGFCAKHDAALRANLAWKQRWLSVFNELAGLFRGLSLMR